MLIVDHKSLNVDAIDTGKYFPLLDGGWHPSFFCFDITFGKSLIVGISIHEQQPQHLIAIYTISGAFLS